MDIWTKFGSLIELIIGIAAVATFFAYMFQAKNSKRLIEILQGELDAHKQGGERLLRERDDYKEKLHTSLNDLNQCRLEALELKSRTDFTPFSQFQKQWYEEQSVINKKMLAMLEGMSGLLTSLNEKLEVAQTPKTH